LEAREERTLRIPAPLARVIPPNICEATSNLGPYGIERTATFERQLRRWEGVGFDPFDYQREVIEGVCAELQQSQMVGMLVLPTGAGKTSVAVAIALRDLARRASGLVIWMAPQRELLQQAITCCERVWWSGAGPHSLDLKVLRGGNDRIDLGRHSVVFGTPITISRWLEREEAVGGITHAIFDEAHHLGAASYTSVWERIRTSAVGLRLALGLSATPMRADGTSFETMLRALDGRLMYPRSLSPGPIAALRSRGVLAEVCVRQIEKIPSYARGALLAAGNVEFLGSDADYWMACIDAVREAPGRLIVYCPTRALGELFSRHLTSIGDHSEFVDGEDALDTRIAVFERFRDGVTRIVVNVGLLLEGVDCPAADGAFVLHPIQSPTRLLQIAGRVMRGPAVGGTLSATIYCADTNAVRFFREISSDPDYAAFWETGIPLG